MMSIRDDLQVLSGVRVRLSTAILRRFPPTFAASLAQGRKSAVGSRLVYGTFWSLVGAVTSRAIGLATFVIVARLFGKEGYGQFAVVQSTVGMFGVVGGFGLGKTATKYVAELRTKDPERAGRIMAMSGLVACVSGMGMALALFAAAPWLASCMLAAPELADILRIGCLVLVLDAMNGEQVGALTGFEAFKTMAKINLWTGLANLPVMTAGVYWWGLTGAVSALVVNRLLIWTLSHVSLREHSRRSGVAFRLRGSLVEMPILWSYSFPAMLGSVMIAPTTWSCNAMLVNQADGYAQMGIVQAAATFQQVLFFVGNALSAPLVPLLANNLGTNNQRLDRFNMLSTWSLGAFCALFLLGFPELAAALFGSDFAGAQFTNTFVLLVFSSSVVIYKQGLARVLAAHGLMWWAMLSNLQWAATLIAGTWFLVSYGAVGYASASVCAYALNVVMFVPLYTYKRLVPEGTIVSFEALAVWALLIGSMSLVLCELGLGWRIAYICPAAVTMGWLFLRLSGLK